MSAQRYSGHRPARASRSAGSSGPRRPGPASWSRWLRQGGGGGRRGGRAAAAPRPARRRGQVVQRERLGANTGKSSPATDDRPGQVGVLLQHDAAVVAGDRPGVVDVARDGAPSCARGPGVVGRRAGLGTICHPGHLGGQPPLRPAGRRRCRCGRGPRHAVASCGCRPGTPPAPVGGRLVGYDDGGSRHRRGRTGAVGDEPVAVEVPELVDQLPDVAERAGRRWSRCRCRCR